MLFLTFALHLGCEDKPSSLIGQSLTVDSSFELNLKLYSYPEKRWVNLGYCEKSKPNVFVQLPPPPWALEFYQDGERILISEYQSSSIDLSFIFKGEGKKSYHPLTALQLNIAKIEDLSLAVVGIANGHIYPMDSNGILKAPIHEEVTILGIWKRNNRVVYYAIRSLPDLYYYQNEPLNLVPQKRLDQQIPFIGQSTDYQLGTGEWVYRGVRTGLIVDQGLLNQSNGLLISIPTQQAIDWGIWFSLSSQHLQLPPIQIKDSYEQVEGYVPAQSFGVKEWYFGFQQSIYPTLGTITNPTSLDEALKIQWESKGTFVDLKINDRQKQGIRIIAPTQNQSLMNTENQQSTSNQSLILNTLALPHTLKEEAWLQGELLEVKADFYDLASLTYDELWKGFLEKDIAQFSQKRQIKSYTGYWRGNRNCVPSDEMGYYTVHQRVGCVAESPVLASIDRCGHLDYPANPTIDQGELNAIPKAVTIPLSALYGHYYALQIYEKTPDQAWKLSVNESIENGPWFRLNPLGEIWLKSDRFTSAGIITEWRAGSGKGLFFQCNQSPIDFEINWISEEEKLELLWEIDDRSYQAFIQRSH